MTPGCVAVFKGCKPLKTQKSQNHTFAFRALKIPGWNYSELPMKLNGVHVTMKRGNHTCFTRTLMLVVWGITMLAILTPVCAAEPDAEQATFTMTLRSLLPSEQQQIVLRNARSEYLLYVPLSERLQVKQAILHLEYTNSIALLGERSLIRVLLNEKIVAQLPLKPDHPDGVADIRLPVDLLKTGYNQIKFEVAQHYTLECEDPAAPELWTQIDADTSSITFVSQFKPVASRLSELMSLIDRKLPGDYKLNIITAGEEMTDSHLQWGALITQGAGLRLDYRSLQVFHQKAQQTPASNMVTNHRFPALDQTALKDRDNVLVGTRDQLTPFLGSEYTDGISGSHLAVFPLDNNPSRFLLIVSGTTDTEVKQAAVAFSTLNFPLPDSSSTLIKDVVIPELPRYAARWTVKQNATYRLSRFGFKTRTIKGWNPNNTNSITIDLWVPPDLYVIEDSEVILRLHLAYGAQLRPDSVLNISLNDQFQKAIPLDDNKGGVFRGYNVRIPARSLVPGRNALTLDPQLVPLKSDHCQLLQFENLYVTIFDDSFITMPDGVHYVRMPDLTRFGKTGFPYNTEADGSELAVQALSRDPETISATWTLIGKLGQIKNFPLHRATFSFDLPTDGRNLVLVGAYKHLDPRFQLAAPLAFGENSNTPYPTVELPKPEPEKPDFWGKLGELFSSPFGAETIATHPEVTRIIQHSENGLGRFNAALQFESPIDSKKTVTVFTSEDSLQLEQGIADLVKPQVWGALEGDIVLWTDALSPVHRQKAGDDYHVGNIGPGTRLGYYFSQNTLYGVAGILLLVLILVLLTRYLLIRYRRKHHPSV